LKDYSRIDWEKQKAVIGRIFDRENETEIMSFYGEVIVNLKERLSICKANACQSVKQMFVNL
jgi:hypothetical protein